MGACCSAPGLELDHASEEDIKRLREKGHMICIAGPSADFDGDNQCCTVYYAEYENGTEMTFLFLDEDRPNRCEDILYDTIRRPLFGRTSDIESIVIVRISLKCLCIAALCFILYVVLATRCHVVLINFIFYCTPL